jgi:glycosyltransferase involved in cell wall biosynthesis
MIGHASDNRPTASARRPRLLMLAYDCVPGEGSDAGLGWQLARQAAEHCETWVLCREDKCRHKIAQYTESHGAVDGLHFEYIPHKRWERWIGRNWYSYYISYHSWHRRAFAVARQLHAQIDFDVVHQVTFNGFREPGLLWKLGVPFVWGPVGGTQAYPWRFLAGAGIRGAVHEATRTLLNSFQLRFSRRVRQASKSAVALVAANSTTQKYFARVHGRSSVLMTDVGIDQLVERKTASRRSKQPLRLLWVGKCECHKALHLLLEALSRLPDGLAYELRIVGSGKLESRWRRMAERLGVAARCHWMGWLPHNEALKQYAWADLFVFTSLRDTSGNVVVEAFSHGLPVICLDHQGARDMVTDRCGIKIPLTTSREAVDGFAAAITRLAHDATSLMTLSHGAIERASHFKWSRQGARIGAIYSEIAGSSYETPEPLSRSTSAAAEPGGFSES